MTPEAFRAALAKGQGRTALALLREDPAPYLDALLGACVENLQWDRQCEQNRAEYLMRLIDLAGIGEIALATILEAFPKAEDGWDRDWMLDLLEEFARRGDARAWDALRGAAATGDKRAQNNLAPSGEAGLQWAERNILPNLADDDLWRIGMWLPDEEADDATPTQRRLRALDQENDARWDAAREARVEPKPTAAGFFRNLDDRKAPWVSAVAFERTANVRQWRKAARRFLRETDERALRSLVRVFRRDAFPLPPQRLFRMARHPERGWAALRILGTLDTPAVRRFALGLVRRRPLPWNALEALSASLRPGDEPMALAALRSVAGGDDETRHNPVLDVVGFMREHPQGRWQPHAEWIYEHSPCSRCRSSAVDWMKAHGALPASILEEAPYDAEPDVRAAVAP